MTIKVFLYSDKLGRNGIYEFPSKDKCYRWLNADAFRRKVKPRFTLKLASEGRITDVRDDQIGIWREVEAV